jgi:hypothetical protein
MSFGNKRRCGMISEERLTAIEIVNRAWLNAEGVSPGQCHDSQTALALVAEIRSLRKVLSLTEDLITANRWAMIEDTQPHIYARMMAVRAALEEK